MVWKVGSEINHSRNRRILNSLINNLIDSLIDLIDNLIDSLIDSIVNNLIDSDRGCEISLWLIMGDRIIVDREDVVDFGVVDFLCFFRYFNSFIFLEFSILNTTAVNFLFLWELPLFLFIDFIMYDTLRRRWIGLDNFYQVKEVMIIVKKLERIVVIAGVIEILKYVTRWS